MRLIAALSLLTLVACGAEPAPILDYAPFVKLVDIWKAEAAARGASMVFPDGLIIRIEVTGSKAVAVCHHTSPPMIQLDPKWWGEFDDHEKEQVLFHEIGHCVLHREHATVGIMEERVLPVNRYKAKRAEYLHEYFNKGESK